MWWATPTIAYKGSRPGPELLSCLLALLPTLALQGLPRWILNQNHQRRGEIFIVWLHEGILIEGGKRTWKIKIRGARSEVDTRATSRRQNNRRDQWGPPENACESVVILWILSKFRFLTSRVEDIEYFLLLHRSSSGHIINRKVLSEILLLLLMCQCHCVVSVNFSYLFLMDDLEIFNILEPDSSILTV
jgi:hypothetical protein